ncbi:MAG TPA: M1 family metallopeptidase [Candidatus Saccharimonadales bacterium]|nr:M1 family metallopeptidase [Candidatus Saccharimonadales bacterium]
MRRFLPRIAALTWAARVLFLAPVTAAPASPAASSAAPPWQQSASYRLAVTLDPLTRTISGSETLTYVNRSPAELRELRFHLYHAAVRPGSALDRARRKAGRWDVAELPAARWGECAVESAWVGGVRCDPAAGAGDAGAPAGQPEPSLARIGLPRPLPPGDSVDVALRFHDRFPGVPGHDGCGRTEFFAGEWFPKVCVYDGCPLHPEDGWHSAAYTGRGEFYSDFGTYDVALTLPASYLVAGTGRLLNPEDVLPEDVRLRLRGLGERPVRVWQREAAPESLRRTAHTWRFRAERVHDFAFAAVETWTWDASRRGGVTVSCVYPPADAGAWSGAISEAADLLADFSARLGAYPYDHLDIVGTRALGASIEKPQTVWIASAHYRDRRSRRFDEVLAHELAHQWFYGMVANDEAGEAFLDEGFATWLALRAVERRFGPRDNLYPPHGALERLLTTPDDLRSELWRSTVDWENRRRGEPAARAADSFATQEAYVRADYDRAALMLDALEQRLGPERLQAALRDYAAGWSFQHPHAADFQAAMERAAGAPLDSFFGFWLHGTQPAEVPPEGLGPAEGDSAAGPAGRPGGLALQFANGVPRLEARRMDRPTLWWRPALAFNDVDGPGAGARLRLEPPRAGWTASAALIVPTRTPGGSVRPWGDAALAGRWWGGAAWGQGSLGYTRGEGRERGRAALDAWLQPDPAGPPRGHLRAALERWSLFQPEYLREPGGWQPGTQWVAATSLAAELAGPGTSWRPELELRKSLAGGPADFLRLAGQLRVVWRGPGGDRLRLRAAAGTFTQRTGAGADLPGAAAQELFRLAGAGPLAEFDDPLLRSRGFFHAGDHVELAGGGGARGYFDRGIVGDRLSAVNIEVPVAVLWPGPEPAEPGGLEEVRLPALQALAFYDVAGVWIRKTEGLSDITLGVPLGYADAGVGLAARGLPWDLRLRLDFPLWLSRPAAGEHPLRLRWLLSMGSLF